MNKSAGIIGKAARGFLFKLRSRPLVWDAFTTTILSTVGKGVGFLIPFFIAAWFGVSAETDAFFFAYGLILFLAGIFAPVVENVIVPYVAEARAKGRDVGAFVGQVFGASALGLSGLAVLFLLVSRPVLGLITRFSPEGLRLVQQILIEAAPLIVLLVWTSILAGTLNAYKRFGLPALSPAFRAVVTLTIIFLFRDDWGVYAIARGYVLGEIFRLVILLGVIYKFRLIRFKFSFSFDPKLREFLKTASFLVIGMVAMGLNPIIDKAMASWLEKGSVSILEYAYRLYFIPITVLATASFTVILSYWSNSFYTSTSSHLDKVYKAFKIIGLIALITTFILLLMSDFLVRFAYGRGSLKGEQLADIQAVFIFYCIGLVPYLGWSLLARYYIVVKATNVFMIFMFINLILHIFLNFIFIWLLGLGLRGIALSTTVTCFLVALLAAYSLKYLRNIKIGTAKR